MEEHAIEVLAESENFSVWRTEELEEEMTYHLELGSVTVHFFREEWDEFLSLVGEVLEYAAEG